MTEKVNVKIELLDGGEYVYNDITQVSNEDGLFSVVYGEEYIYSYPLANIRSIYTEVSNSDET